MTHQKVHSSVAQRNIVKFLLIWRHCLEASHCLGIVGIYLSQTNVVIDAQGQVLQMTAFLAFESVLIVISSWQNIVRNWNRLWHCCYQWSSWSFLVQNCSPMTFFLPLNETLGRKLSLHNKYVEELMCAEGSKSWQKSVEHSLNRCTKPRFQPDIAEDVYCIGQKTISRLPQLIDQPIASRRSELKKYACTDHVFLVDN